MKKISSLILILSTLMGSCLGNQNSPVFALIEYDPWASVPGIDSSTFALYKDGTVIYLRKDSDGNRNYYTCNIASNKTLLAEFDLKSRNELKNSYIISTGFDETSSVFYWNDKKIHVYGDISHPPPNPEGDPASKDINKRRLQRWNTCPSELKELLQKVRDFDCPNATKWLPNKIEVMFYPYQYPPENSLVWPKDWPDLKDKYTKKRGEDLYSVYISSDHHDTLIKFLTTEPNKAAVLIDGKTMAAAMRYPFPQEQQWMK